MHQVHPPPTTKAEPTRRRLLAVVVAVAAAAAALAAAAAAPAAPSRDGGRPDPFEPVTLERLVVPGVTGMTFPDWLPDGEHLVAASTSVEEPRAQLAVVAADGGGYRCLTCGLDLDPDADDAAGSTQLVLDKPYAFRDGERVLARLVTEPEDDRGIFDVISGPTQDFRFVVLECGPSVLQCDERRLVPVTFPGGGLKQGVQNREARVSPDGRMLAWTEVQSDGARMSLGRLVRRADRYELADVRVLNPEFELAPPDPTGLRLGGPLYELKNFAPDGKTLTYASFADAENYDVWELDLATGERRRLTRDIEWNEGTTRSPDNRSFVNFSSRELDRMAPFALLPRPPFIDFATYSLTGRFALNEDNRKCLLSPWLVDAGGERGRYFGQPLDPDPPAGYAPHGNGPFSPDGTKVAFWEHSETATPASQLVVARLPTRRPAPVAGPIDTPYPTWAVPREEWRGYQDRRGVFVVEGPKGGTATIRLLGETGSMRWAVRYDGWSEDGRTRLDGTEEVAAPMAAAYGRWTAALRLTGERTGFLDADVTVRTGGQASGTLTTEYEGRRYHGLPTDVCADLATPQLAVTARDRRGERLAVRITGTVPGDPTPRPVRGARVTSGAASGVTDERGRVVLQDAGDTVRAEAGGFAAAERPVR